MRAEAGNVTQPIDHRLTWRARLSDWRPPTVLWLGGALFWGLAVAAADWFGHWLFSSVSAAHSGLLATIYLLGAACGWLIALPLLRILGAGRPFAVRTIAALVLLAGATIALIAFGFAMQYRQFYSRWHAPFGTITWCYQFFYTGLVALYQFAVLGTRPLLPAGSPLVLIASLWLARQKR